MLEQGTYKEGKFNHDQNSSSGVGGVQKQASASQHGNRPGLVMALQDGNASEDDDPDE